MRGTSRALRAGVTVAAAALVLTGCGGDDKDADGPTPAGPTQDSGCGFVTGPSSESVEVSGEFGAEVTPTFAKPLKPSGIERTVLTPGSGKDTKDGSAVNATVSVFNGKTGDRINQQTNKTTVGDTGTPQVLAAGLRCVPVGSRVVTVAPASDLFGTEGNADVGLAGTDGVVIVTDIAEVVKPPKTETWSDAPSVTFNSGRTSPTIEVPSGEAPDQVLVDVLRPGTGAKVQAGDQVTVDFKTVVWGSSKVVAETYGKGKSPVTFGTNDFVPGFTAAIVGQRGGARLLVAVPPEFGFGPGGSEASGISGDDTLLIVIEIQATKALPAS